MAVTITHPFVSPVADAGNPDEVGPNEWNAAHTIVGLGTAAEADATTLLARANHTGTQAASTISDFSTAADARIAAAVGITVQAYDADLATWAGVTSSANGRSLVSAADYAAMRALLDLEPGTDFYSISAANAAFQPLDADLTAWAGVNPSSYSTTAAIAAAYQPLDADLTSWAGVTRAVGFDTFAATPSSANLRALLSDEEGTGAAYFVGGALGTPSSATLTNATGLPVSGITASTSTALGVGSVELGHATDTTLSRGAAGFIAVEGNRVPSPASQASGDLLYRGATEWERLAKGTALQVLRQNSALTAPEWSTAREVLTANRTYYVRTDGSDSNNGLANTAGDAFLTIQKALNEVALLDFAGFTVTVQIGDGTYTTGGGVPVTVGQANINNFVIQGNSGSPGNVVVSVTSSNGFVANCGVRVLIKDLELRVTTSGYGLMATGFGALISFSNIRFGATANSHILAVSGGYVNASGNYSIVGNTASHITSDSGGLVEIANKTITLTGSIAFSGPFAVASQANIRIFSNTYSGSATGSRYLSQMNGTIQTFGAGASALPGNSAGSVATGGQYA